MMTHTMNMTDHLGAQLASLRPHLLRFAMHKVHERAIAEDLVQDVLVAALETPTRFKQGSSLSTYLIGILKFKLIDHFRYEKKFLSASDQQDYLEFHEAFDCKKFLPSYGLYGGSLNNASEPEQILEQKRTLERVQMALNQLPNRSARALTLFDYFGFDADEICEDLALTKNHLMVILHRTRSAMRDMVS